MPNRDEIRAAQRKKWAGLSAGWEKWDSIIMDQLGPVSTAMLDSLDIADNQRHLGSIRVHVSSRPRQSHRRIRARTQAGRTSLLVGVG